MVRAFDSHSQGHWFEPGIVHHAIDTFVFCSNLFGMHSTTEGCEALQLIQALTADAEDFHRFAPDVVVHYGATLERVTEDTLDTRRHACSVLDAGQGSADGDTCRMIEDLQWK